MIRLAAATTAIAGRADGASANGQAGLEAVELNLPDSITADQLDPEATAELRTLPGDLASVIARLLVATSLAEDPDEAFRFAKKARGLAARVGVVRETCAIAAYQAGDWNAALAEFRAARRLTGRSSYLPLMADCERGLGRLDRALDLVTGPDARSADQQTRIELRIVESGIRRDQGLFDAAVVALQGPELTGERTRPEFARLYYAYADALLQAGRTRPDPGLGAQRVPTSTTTRTLPSVTKNSTSSASMTSTKWPSSTATTFMAAPVWIPALVLIPAPILMAAPSARCPMNG